MADDLPQSQDGQAGSLGHVLLSSMRDEGPYLLEFVAHHRAIGFDRLFIASNDCQDGTDVLLDALDAAGVLTHYRSDPKPGQRPQHVAYRQMRARFGLDDAEWLMVLDADEFLDVTVGRCLVRDLTSAAPPDVDIIALNPHSFGTSDDVHWRPGLVTEQFTRRLLAKNRFNGPVKSLTRGLGRFREINNHSVVGNIAKLPLTVMRGDGSLFVIAPDERIWTILRFFPQGDIRRGLAHYNHYPIKSLVAYCLRQARGRGAAPKGEENDRHTYEYFERFASARIRDVGFEQRHGARLRAEYARLLTLPGIAEAQAEAERRYAGMAEAMMQDDESLLSL